ncbi:hypothetical protein NQZ68_009156 [Dissostichus eleginoides]|nr:hypothetical protein NQZ68_009156 [Dissostichus eleginoides]
MAGYLAKNSQQLMMSRTDGGLNTLQGRHDIKGLGTLSECGSTPLGPWRNTTLHTSIIPQEHH